MQKKENTESIDRTIEKERLTPLASSIIKTLLYFDIFDHPLQIDEIKELNTTKTSETDFESSLLELIKNRTIGFSGGFYYVSDKHGIIKKRERGNLMAEKYFKIAKRVSRFISWFPYVRCICISGTLSKNYFDKNSDIDYFIITAPNRLWLCRTMLVVFKKIALFNSKKYFCVNYFIDSNNLEIPDKNIFTATELVHLKPTYNIDLYNKLIDRNRWVEDFYSYKKNTGTTISSKNTLTKKITEKIFNGSVGERLDKWCFKMTIGNWKKKFPGFSDEEFDLNLRSRRNVSKHHPQGFQFKVLKAYAEKIKEFEGKFDVKLVP